ncbi:unnamed protein product [Urochloa humidicola]
MENHVLEHILDGREEPSNLPFSLLKHITKSFSEEREIGQGGFATVYKGVLPNGNVAVKRIKNGYTIDEKLFYREVNSLLNVNHENVVRFLGFCANTEQTAMKIEGLKHHIYAEIRERLLCFEYISNGSLQKYIADELRGLEWDTRYRIIKGICNGLHYLHKEKHIIHMDLKPDNILVDSFMVPKITDFGLSRLDDKSQTVSGNRFATLGYCAPEYLNAGRMSFKSDMYSLGVIIMELVTGRKGVCDNNSVLRRWRHRWNKSAKETSLLYQQIQVIKCIKLGLLCQEHDPCKRPFIWDVIRDINKMESTYGKLRNPYESSVSQISSYAEDDMLGIEPLELYFTFELNKPMSSSLQLTNGADCYMAFNIQTTSPLPYCTMPNKGIVPPRSKCIIHVTLPPQEKIPQHADQFILRSTKVNSGLSIEDINNELFNRQQTGKVVDEVDLGVVFEAQGEAVSEEVYEHFRGTNSELSYIRKRQMFSCVAEKRRHESIETPKDGLLRPCHPFPQSNFNSNFNNHNKKARRSQQRPFISQRGDAILQRLVKIFPEMDPQLLIRALEASGDDLDSATKSLMELRLESSAMTTAIGCESENGIPTGVQAMTTAIGCESENGLTTAVLPSAEGSVTNKEWVELFVKEMIQASDIDDARARAARALEAMKKSILNPAKSEAMPDDITSDTHASL